MPVRYWSGLFFIFFFASCGKSDPKIPIEEEKLVKLLADVHLAEAAMQDMYGETKDSTAHVYYQQIYHLHEVNHIIFDSSMAILRRNPSYASKVYGQVMKFLEDQEDADNKR